MKKISMFLMMAADRANGAGAKYEAAVNRARGTSEQPAEGADLTTTNADGGAAMITKYDPSQLASMLSDPGMEWAPQNREIKVGEMISGILEGYGPDATFENLDKATGKIETRVVNTWVIAAPDGSARASILSSAQLDRKLPGFIGGPVKIMRGEDIKLAGGHRCSDYVVGGPKLSGGAKRTFAQPKPAVIDVQSIEGGHSAPQLPAGSAS